MSTGIRVLALLLLMSTAACHRKAAALDAAPAATDDKAVLAAMAKSFRAFVDATYPQVRAPQATRTCHLQTSVARRTGPPDVWSGNLSGEIVKGALHVRIRVKFAHPDDATWTCTEDGSRIISGFDGDAGPAPASVCAYLAGACGPP